MSALATPQRGDRRRLMVTPEGRGARFGALALDLIFIFLAILGFSVAIIYLAGGLYHAKVEEGRAGAALQFLFILWIAAMFLFRNAWFLYFELGARGATPGKRIVGIRIAARDGGRLTAEMVIARNLLRDIELFLPLGAAAQGASLATGTTYRFGAAELGIYGEYELQTLERVLRDGRAEAIAAVHEAICRKIGWNPGNGDERAFLEAFYTQLRARLEAGMRMGQRKADKFT